jgi:CCR4-NOT transcription complex subunit 7/8
MAPAGSRYGPNNMSNPFVSYNQNQSHQPSHLQHPSQNFQAQNLGGHPGFSNPNLGFFSNSGNAGLAAGFQGGGGLGGGSGTGLGSHAAQMGFEHGAALQQQQARGGGGAGAGGAAGAGPKNLNGRVREVWRSNLAEEMDNLRNLVDKYTYISMVRFGRLESFKFAVR